MGKKENKLNNLTGREWLYWTDTFYATHFPPDLTYLRRKKHGAMKPPELMGEIIKFFTKEGEWVLDPFAGVGGTLLGAALCNRNAVGMEINEAWCAIYRTIQKEYVVIDGRFTLSTEIGSQNEVREISSKMMAGDCLQLLPQFENCSFDAVIADPPYGCFHGIKGFAGESNFNMQSRLENDFGNSPGFDAFLSRIEDFGREIWRILRPGKYCILIIGDRYYQGEYLTLGSEVAARMKMAGFKLKGIKIWSNRATVRPLKPYAIYHCFVPNITHQNILILQK